MPFCSSVYLMPFYIQYCKKTAFVRSYLKRVEFFLATDGTRSEETFWKKIDSYKKHVQKMLFYLLVLHRHLRLFLGLLHPSNISLIVIYNIKQSFSNLYFLVSWKQFLRKKLNFLFHIRRSIIQHTAHLKIIYSKITRYI